MRHHPEPKVIRDLGNEVKPVIRLADTVEVSSLEKTGSKLGHRYKKATRAKDISNATAKDMEVKTSMFSILCTSLFVGNLRKVVTK